MGICQHVADAADLSTEDYDLACIFDAWHDIWDEFSPAVGIAKAIRWQKLAGDGTFTPDCTPPAMAFDGLQNNIDDLNPGAGMWSWTGPGCW